jgi:hypothetical protein
MTPLVGMQNGQPLWKMQLLSFIVCKSYLNTDNFQTASQPDTVVHGDNSSY